VTPDRSATFAAVAGLLDVRDRDAFYWSARFSFVTGRDQLATFDAVFAALVDGIADPAGATRGDLTAPPPPRAASRRPAPAAEPARPASGAGAAADAAGSDRAAARDVLVGMRASDVDRLSHARLDALDDAELVLVEHLLRRLALATPPRRSRRARTSRRGERLDVRATLRRSRRTGGDPVAHLHRRRRARPRPLVALLDISGSMAPYARAYLLLLEGAARGAHAETFVFATRLTRVTRALRQGRAQAALERASAIAPDWAGGTRIGAALRAFNDGYGRRGMARDAVVVVLSDGWERGDPALLGRELERLARLAYRIVWVNPRVAAPGFAPVTGGMAAALPHVDELVSGHSVVALDRVIDAIGRHR
ncbi:MAG TPA: VWA domain-containing protein, partial [Solirubrobacteraceae bacterium]|nr:VWA domain-containing protein [Solirubrobacteraceae bacterium]